MVMPSVPSFAGSSAATSGARGQSDAFFSSGDFIVGGSKGNNQVLYILGAAVIALLILKGR